ncbi:MAG: hypothetical protein HYR86_06265 [Candidatus Rokubacteria bacterium]|nr:hypothetical protein [Candidatus Rokubacteria bacterium]
MADPRRSGIVALVVLLAGGPLLASLPWGLAAVRIAGVGLLWWYALAAAPLAAAALTAAALDAARRRG